MKYFSLLLIVFIGVSLKAQESSLPKVAFDVYGGVGIAQLSRSVINKYPSIEAVPKFGVMLGGGVYLTHFNFNIELGGFGIKDNESFTQLTTAGVYESSTQGWQVSPSIGGYYELGQLGMALNLGYTFVTAQRSIGDCSDCDVENLPLQNGMAIRPKAMFNFKNSNYLFASYEHYFSNDVKSLFLIGFGRRIVSRGSL